MRTSETDPELGRFISADTIVQAPYDPQSLNRYSYCRNNPLNYVDPTGHSWKGFLRVLGFILDVVMIAVGVMTGNPYLIASGSLALFNSATSGYQGGGWDTAHQVIGYTAAAFAVAGAFYSPSGSPSAELGYDSNGNYVGTEELGRVVVTKTREAIRAEEATQFGNAASGTFAAAQAGITAAGAWAGSILNNTPVGIVERFLIDGVVNGFHRCPRYGNWGGEDWSGGRQIRVGEIGPDIPSIDQMDAYFKQHDYACYYALKVSSPVMRRVLIERADHILYGQLRSLPEDPSKWSSPAPDPQKARLYRKQAEWWFKPSSRYQ